MNILFVCTDNFTRSVIAEFCMRDYLGRNNVNSISVSSAGVRANSDISGYSDIHFEIMKDIGIDISGFKRTMFDENCFNSFDYIIGMSNLHLDFIKEKYGRDILLFNEVLDGSNTPVQVGEPDSEGFHAQMRELVEYINSAMPKLIDRLKKN
jgi:protein-tyrosine phosphatase